METNQGLDLSFSGEISIKTPKKPKKPKKIIQKHPWPRLSNDEDKVPLGVDVVAKMNDIKKIVHKFFKVKDITMDELLQEVYISIINKNYLNSAHDPRKSSFGHYVYMVANNVCKNIVQKEKRHDKEKDSLDYSYSKDGKTILEVVEDPEQNPGKKDINDYMNQVENILYKKGLRDHARYIRSVKYGSDPEVIRMALSFGSRNYTSKAIRELRHEIKDSIFQICCDL